MIEWHLCSDQNYDMISCLVIHIESGQNVVRIIIGVDIARIYIARYVKRWQSLKGNA